MSGKATAGVEVGLSYLSGPSIAGWPYLFITLVILNGTACD